MLLTVGCICFAQTEIKERPNLPDTILKKGRTLFIRDSLNAAVALQKLFPGKKYNLNKKNSKDFLISWRCSKCAVNTYNDVNGINSDQQFPYTEGVATRLINVIDYADAQGNRFKLLTFNHSVYDSDGLQTGRFTGGLLGVAKFRQVPGGWEMRSFDPAIAAYGAFSRCPEPAPILIGEDQFAFTISHANAAAGAPYYAHVFLIAGVNGSYKQIMIADHVERFNVGKARSNWNYKISTVNDSTKKNFRDILIKITGTYFAPSKKTQEEDEYEEDLETLDDLADYTKGKKQFDFVVERIYTYKNGNYHFKSSTVALNKVK